MQQRLRDVISDASLAQSLVNRGLETIRARHTCRHRVDELLGILTQVGTSRVTDQLENLEAAQ